MLILKYISLRTKCHGLTQHEFDAKSIDSHMILFCDGIFRCYFICMPIDYTIYLQIDGFGPTYMYDYAKVIDDTSLI